MRAYGQSAGYAQQALDAIQIVVAFGMEDTEKTNYNRFLHQVYEQTAKAGWVTGASLGFFMFSIYGMYAYAFLMGSIWVDQEIYNHTYDRVYGAGDSISTFFGVLFGLFALASTGPAFNALAEGKAAGKLAFDVIDRQPSINQDSKTGQEHVLEGAISFNEVDFYYPTR